MAKDAHVVTGAFGYSGRWIAKELLNCGHRVRTLTNAIGRDDPFDGQVEVRPIDNDMKERKYKTASLFYNSPNSTK